MKKEDLDALVGQRIASIEYDDEEHPTAAYIVVEEGSGYGVQVIT